MRPLFWNETPLHYFETKTRIIITKKNKTNNPVICGSSKNELKRRKRKRKIALLSFVSIINFVLFFYFKYTFFFLFF